MRSNPLPVILVALLMLLCAYIAYTNYSKETIRQIYDTQQEKKSREKTHQMQEKATKPVAAPNRVSNRVSNIDWVSTFSFVPYDIQLCKAMFPPNTSRDYVEIFKEVSSDYEVFLKESTYQRSLQGAEGSSVLFPEQVMTHRQLAKSDFVKTICETGFNLGESAFNWLSSKPDVKLYSFDIGSHPYAHEMAKVIEKMFPGRFTITWGDSTKTLPEFRQTHPEVKCNILFIDGGHSNEVCQADYDNFRYMAHEDNIMILDDYPDYKALASVWEEARQKGELAEIFRCVYRRDLKDDNLRIKGHGFTVARLLSILIGS